MTELIHFSDDEDLHRVLGPDVEGRHRRERAAQVPDQRAGGEQAQSQIEEYLDYEGAGVQHVALSTRDIVGAVAELGGAAWTSCRSPGPTTTRYPTGSRSSRTADLAGSGILVDRDDEGYIQIFTKPLGDRPTLFFELIERHGSRCRRGQLPGALPGSRARAGEEEGI